MNVPFPVLDSKHLLRKIIEALDNKKPLSVISLGATETYVMAQYTVLSEREFMKHPQAITTNKNKSQRGFRFPNVELRDELVNAARVADIIAYPYLIQSENAGLMTERVMKAYKIVPKYVFEANIRRVVMVSQKKLFKKMLKGRKLLLIGRVAKEVEIALNQSLKKELGFEIVGSINIDSYSELPMVKKEIAQYEFDLCLLSAGVYAVILASYIAQGYQKVAFDLGQGLKTLIDGEIQVTAFVKSIGLEQLKLM